MDLHERRRYLAIAGGECLAAKVSAETLKRRAMFDGASLTSQEVMRSTDDTGGTAGCQVTFSKIEDPEPTLNKQNRRLKYGPHRREVDP